MSNAIIKQQGDASVVADNIWQFRLGAGSFVLGTLAGAAGMAALSQLKRRYAAGFKPATPTGWPTIFAHRGGSKVVPEDTVEGFREAKRLSGPIVVELDVHASADGVLVVTHDAQVDRTTDGTGSVGEQTLSELQRLDAGYRFTTDGGSTFPWRGKGVRIPTLETIYREFPDDPVNIEIKGSRPGIEESIARTIAAAGAEARTLVVADRLSTIRRFRRASRGSVATGASPAELLAFWLSSTVGLPGLPDAQFQALQAPEKFKGLRIVTPGFVRAAHERGLRVDVWTIDEERDMRRLLSLGVDGIMTDRPDLLGQVLGTAPADHGGA
jgi:glycerophosphoryl diester phosphodiesterase